MALRTVFAAALAVCVRGQVTLAAFDHVAAGPRSLALGNAVVAAGPVTWTAFENPAGLATCRASSAGFFYIPGLFGLAELRYSGGTLVLPVAGTGLALTATRFGYDLYNETAIGLAAGRSIVSGIEVGCRFQLNRLAIEEYGSCAAIAVDIGIRIECSGSLSIGGVYSNVTGSALGASGEMLPQELTGGVWYTPIRDLRIAVSAGKEILSAPELRCGVEADIVEWMTLRAGIIDNPSVVSGGCAFRVENIAAEYGLAYHWILGATHAIGLTISFP
jgi:hypothetical protein